MASYRIICTRQEPVSKPHSHAHIVSVGTGTRQTSYDKQWTVDEVYRAIDRGDRFYTKSESTGEIAYVIKWGCLHCGFRTLKSTADAVTDNNLDYLVHCG